MPAKTKNGNPKKNLYAKVVFNSFWLIFMSFVGFFVAATDVFFQIYISPWYLALIVTLGPVMIIQSLIYWTIQRYFFHQKNSFFWTLIMNVFILLGFFILFLIDFSLNVHKLKT